MDISIRKLTTDCQHSPDFKALFDLYAKECGTTAFGDWRANWQMYARLENAGCIHAFCAYDGVKPVGIIVGIEVEQFHYSLKSMTVDAIFVLKEYRNSSVSTRLLSSVMRVAKEKGIDTLLFSCPPNGDFDKALSHQKNFHLISKIYRRN